MAFSLSGNIITQTGTDTDMSGLSPISGVVTYGAGQEQTDYILDGLKLVVNGNLTIDPERESIRFVNSASVELTINGTLTADGITNSTISGKPSRNTWITMSRASNGIGILTNGGSNLILRGGVISIYPQITILGDVTFESAVVDGHHVNRFELHQTPTFLGEGVEVLSSRTSISKDVMTLTNYAARFSRGIDPSYRNGTEGSPTSNGTDLTLINYQTQANAHDIQIRYFCNINVFNSQHGGALNITPFVVGADNANNGGVIRIWSGVTFACKDINDNLLQNVKIQTVDTDSGNRQDVSSRFDPYFSDNFDFTNGNSYEWVTDAAGTDTQQNILSVVHTLPTTDAANDYFVDYRDINNNGSDVFNFRAASYNHVLLEQNLVCRGMNGNNFPLVFIEDALITEKDDALTSAYSAIETAQKWYDRDKYDLVNNYNREQQAYTLRVGNTIDAGAAGITIVEGVNANPIQQTLSGGVITAETVYVGSGFIDTIKTTGTVTDAGAIRTLKYSVTNVLELTVAAPVFNPYILDGGSYGTVNGPGTTTYVQLRNGATVESAGPGIILYEPVELQITDIAPNSKVYLFNEALEESDPNYELGPGELVNNGVRLAYFNKFDAVVVGYSVVNLQYGIIEGSVVMNKDVSFSIKQGIDRVYRND